MAIARRRLRATPSPRDILPSPREISQGRECAYALVHVLRLGPERHHEGGRTVAPERRLQQPRQLRVAVGYVSRGTRGTGEGQG